MSAPSSEGTIRCPNSIVITARDERSRAAPPWWRLRNRVSARAEVDAVELDLVWVDRLAAILETLRRSRRGDVRDTRARNSSHRGKHDSPERREPTRGDRNHSALRGNGRICPSALSVHRVVVWAHARAGLRAHSSPLPPGLRQGPVERLVTLYASDFELIGVQPWSAAVAIADRRACWGSAGAWVAVARVLAEESIPR